MFALFVSACGRSQKPQDAIIEPVQNNEFTQSTEVGGANGDTKPFEGRAYQTEDGRSSLRLISNEEADFHMNGQTFSCRYSNQDNGLRVIATDNGSQKVVYFQYIHRGIQSNDGIVYLDSANFAEVQQQKELERQAKRRDEEPSYVYRAPFDNF